ncbi:MAG: hypothetical protein ABIN67_14240, partial [Ferruginibacter sp.]
TAKKSQEQTMGSARLFRPAPREHPAFFLVIKMVYRIVDGDSFFKVLFGLFVWESLDYLLAFDRGVTGIGISAFLFLQCLAFNPGYVYFFHPDHPANLLNPVLL